MLGGILMVYIALGCLVERLTVFYFNIRVTKEVNISMIDTFKNKKEVIDEHYISCLIDKIKQNINPRADDNVIYVPLNYKTYNKYSGYIMNKLIHCDFVDTIFTVLLFGDMNIYSTKNKQFNIKDYEFDYTGEIHYDFYEKKKNEVYLILREFYECKKKEIMEMKENGLGLL